MVSEWHMGMFTARKLPKTVPDSDFTSYILFTGPWEPTKAEITNA